MLGTSSVKAHRFRTVLPSAAGAAGASALGASFFGSGLTSAAVAKYSSKLFTADCWVKVSKIISYFGYELGIFIILGIQAFFNRGMIINMENDFNSYYLLDYSMGFNSPLAL